MPDKTKDLYDDVLNNIVKEKGGTRETYENLLYQISNLESGGDPTIKQRSGGPGRGKYQFETGVGYSKMYGEDGKHQTGHFKGTSNRIYYSAVRTKNYLKTLGKKIPQYITDIIDNETGDASILTEKQQDILALGDLRMGPVNLKDYAEGTIKGKDIYLDNWWAGKDKDHRKKLNDRWDNAYDEDFTPREDLGMSGNSKSNEFRQQPLERRVDQTPIYNKKSDKGFSKGDFDNFLSKRREENQKKFQAQSQIQPIDGQPIQSEPMQAETSSAVNTMTNENADGGMLNHFKGGGTHEQNPMGGIDQGMGSNGKRNTVEEDETSFDFPEGKFIFSNRVKIYK